LLIGVAPAFVMERPKSACVTGEEVVAGRAVGIGEIVDHLERASVGSPTRITDDATTAAINPTCHTPTPQCMPMKERIGAADLAGLNPLATTSANANPPDPVGSGQQHGRQLHL